MIRLLASVLLALGIAAPAFAYEDFERHTLTLPLLEKFQAASLEADKLSKNKDEDKAAKDDMTTDEMVKMLDATPGVKPLLAKHGLTSRSYALTALALFQAGFWVAMESSMDKKKAAAQLAAYSPETRANIELLRKNPKLMQKLQK
jgi:predicted protein tyrosine phosphatase